MRKRIILITIIFFITGSEVLHSTLLEMEGGVRQQGMGEAFTGIADDINCMYYNPAGMGQMQKGEIYLTYNNLYHLDLIHNYIISIAAPDIAKGSLGFSYRSISVGNKVDFMGDYNEDLYRLCYGIEILPLFYFGVNLKFLKINYNKINGSAISYDGGVLIRAFDKHLSVGLIIVNINKPALVWNNKTKESYSSLLRLGLGLRPNNNILIGMDIARPNTEQYDIHLGGEIWLLKRILAPRIGMAYLQKDGMVLSFGLSIRYHGMRLDYTVERHYELGYNNVFGILIKF